MFNRRTTFFGLLLVCSLALFSFAREDGASSEIVLPTLKASTAGHRTDDKERTALPVLQLEKLVRADMHDSKLNPFAGKSWTNSLSLSSVMPAVKAVEHLIVPSIPFKYMGRIKEEGEHPVVFFTQGSQAYAVSEGGEINGSYRLESVSPTQLVLIYLPLHTKQTLNIGELEMESDENSNSSSSDGGINTLLRDTAVEKYKESESQ